MRRGIDDVGQVKLGCVLFPKVEDILAGVDEWKALTIQRRGIEFCAVKPNGTASTSFSASCCRAPWGLFGGLLGPLFLEQDERKLQGNAKKREMKNHSFPCPKARKASKGGRHHQKKGG